jgi:putative transposase
MKLIKAYKLRIYPTGRQKQELDRWFRVSRKTFNFALNIRKNDYKEYKTKLFLSGLRAGWVNYSAADLKKKYPQNIYDLELLLESLDFTLNKFKDSNEKANAYKFTHNSIGSFELKPSIDGILSINNDESIKYKGVKIDSAMIWIKNNLVNLQNIASLKLGILKDEEIKFPNAVKFQHTSVKRLVNDNPEYKWATEAPAYVYRESKIDVDDAFARMFKYRNGYPKFKSYKNSTPKCRMANVSGLLVKSNKIRIPCASMFGKDHEWLRLSRKNYIPIGQHIKYSQVSLSKKGSHWFLSLQLHEEVPNPKETNGKTLGLDIGGREFIINSNSKTYGGEFYKKACNKLAELEQRKALLNKRRDRRYGPVEKEIIIKNGINLPNKGLIKLDSNLRAVRQKSSNGWRKIVKQIQNIDRQIGYIMNDLRHQTSSRIIKEGYSTYNLENLKIKDMMRKTPGGTSFNKRMRKMWAKLGAYSFKEQLVYKADWNNAKVNSVEPHYTSQQCHNCGELNRKLGSKEIFKCNSCGYGLTKQAEVVKVGYLPDNHRDCNAARNIRDFEKFQTIRENAWKEKLLRAGEVKNSDSQESDNNRGSAEA